MLRSWRDDGDAESEDVQPQDDPSLAETNQNLDNRNAELVELDDDDDYDVTVMNFVPNSSDNLMPKEEEPIVDEQLDDHSRAQNADLASSFMEQYLSGWSPPRTGLDTSQLNFSPVDHHYTLSATADFAPKPDEMVQLADQRPCSSSAIGLNVVYAPLVPAVGKSPSFLNHIEPVQMPKSNINTQIPAEQNAKPRKRRPAILQQSPVRRRIPVNVTEQQWSDEGAGGSGTAAAAAVVRHCIMCNKEQKEKAKIIHSRASDIFRCKNCINRYNYLRGTKCPPICGELTQCQGWDPSKDPCDYAKAEVLKKLGAFCCEYKLYTLLGFKHVEQLPKKFCVFSLQSFIVGTDLEVFAQLALDENLPRTMPDQRRIFVDPEKEFNPEEQMCRHVYDILKDELMGSHEMSGLWPIAHQRSARIAQIAKAVVEKLWSPNEQQKGRKGPKQNGRTVIIKDKFPLKDDQQQLPLDTGINDFPLDIASIEAGADEAIIFRARLANDPNGQLEGVKLGHFNTNWVMRQPPANARLDVANLSVGQLAGLLIGNYSQRTLTERLIRSISDKWQSADNTSSSSTSAPSPLKQTPYVGIRWAKLKDNKTYKTFCIEEFTKRLSDDFREKERIVNGIRYGGLNGRDHSEWLRSKVEANVQRCSSGNELDEAGNKFDNMVILFMGTPIMVSMYKVIEPAQGTRYRKKTIRFCDNFVLFATDPRLETELRQKALGDVLFRANSGVEMVEFTESNDNVDTITWQYRGLPIVENKKEVVAKANQNRHMGFEYAKPFKPLF